MTNSHRTLGRSPRLIFLLAVGLIALSLCTVSCRQVADPAGGTSLGDASEAVSACIDQCNATAAARVAQQLKVHNIAVFLCKGDPVCLAKETLRYNAALQTIETDRLACIAQCHHQGGATAGH